MYYTIRIILFVLAVDGFSQEHFSPETFNPLPLNASFLGTVKCRIDTLINLNYGKCEECLNYPDKGLYTGPLDFTADENGFIYILNLQILYKYGKGNKLIWKRQFNNRVIDIHYYKSRIFLLMPQSLLVIDAISAQDLNSIELEKLNIKDHGIRNISTFDDRYIIFRDLDSNKFTTKIHYVYDLDKNILSRDMLNEDDVPIASNCESCDRDFLKRLFRQRSTITYSSQSDIFLIYKYLCDTVIYKECKKRSKKMYYLIDKKTFSIKEFGAEFNRSIANSIMTRPFVFINDTTAIYELKNAKNGKWQNIAYCRITIDKW